MRLIFIPEKFSEVHCVTGREARSLPFYWFSTLKFFLNPVREFPFYHSHVRYTDETKRKFEKSSASEVGVLWAVHLDRFENLRFHHRGMKFHEIDDDHDDHEHDHDHDDQDDDYNDDDDDNDDHWFENLRFHHRGMK